MSGRLVSVLYTLVAETPAVEKARELKIWLVESRKEIVKEEVLGAGGADAYSWRELSACGSLNFS